MLKLDPTHSIPLFVLFLFCVVVLGVVLCAVVCNARAFRCVWWEGSVLFVHLVDRDVDWRVLYFQTLCTH